MSPRGRRTATAAIVAGVVAVAVVLGAWVLRDRDGDTNEREAPSGPREPATLAVLSVTGTPAALLAVVGAEGSVEPAAMVVPPETTIVVPGQGESTTEEVQALPGDGMRIAVSNAIGAWASRFGVLDVEALSVAVDRAGGLRVTLPDPVTVQGEVVGPGEATMTGPQAEAYLMGAGQEAALRWMVVLEGLLRGQILEASDLAEADDGEGVIALLGAASDAGADLLPTQVVGGTTKIPAQPALDDLMGGLFATPPPTPVVVENGSGEAGVGELVGERIIPEGYRIVLSNNAESFSYEETEITAVGDEHVGDAEAIRVALGTGLVQVTQVPSGLADVVIVTGKDLRA